MFSFLDKFFKKDNKNEMPVPDVKEYVSCKSLQGGITFMHRSFRVCCSNKVGVTLVDNYKGEPIDWKKIAGKSPTNDILSLEGRGEQAGELKWL